VWLYESRCGREPTTNKGAQKTSVRSKTELTRIHELGHGFERINTDSTEILIVLKIFTQKVSALQHLRRRDNQGIQPGKLIVRQCQITRLCENIVELFSMNRGYSTCGGDAKNPTRVRWAGKPAPNYNGLITLSPQ